MVYNLKNHLNRFHAAAIIANVKSHISKIEESEIRRQNLWLRLLEIQRRYEKEEDELN